MEAGESKPFRVLIVDDSADDYELILRALKIAGVIGRRVETKPELEATLEEPWDLVIVDWALPQLNAPITLEMLQSTPATRSVPCIVVSGHLDTEAAVIAIKLGARDCLSKQELDRLPHIVQRELLVAR